MISCAELGHPEPAHLAETLDASLKLLAATEPQPFQLEIHRRLALRRLLVAAAGEHPQRRAYAHVVWLERVASAERELLRGRNGPGR